MLNPINIIEGALSTMVGAKTKESLDAVLGDRMPELKQIMSEQTILLTRILQELSTADNPDTSENIQFTADATGQFNVGSYQIPEYTRNHLLMWIPACTMNIGIPGLALAVKTISNPGWYQLDLPTGTQLSTTTTLGARVVWSDFARGTSF
jgi:hypothetical protein